MLGLTWKIQLVFRSVNHEGCGEWRVQAAGRRRAGSRRAPLRSRSRRTRQDRANCDRTSLIVNRVLRTD